jgi:hypothetical protein
MALPSWNPSDVNFDPMNSFGEWLKKMANSLTNFVQYTFNYWNQQVLPQVNTLFTSYGPDIAAAATITVTNQIHRITGTAAISTILQPSSSIGVGPLMLYAGNGFTLTTGGNVTPALTIPAGHGAFGAFHPALNPPAGLWVFVTA